MAVSLPEVLLVLIDRGLEGYNLFSLYNHGDLAWFGLTIGCLWMPGLLHIIYWVSQLRCCCDDLSIKSAKFWKWILFGLLFPVSIFLSIIKLEYAPRRVHRSLQSFAESAPQIVLQTYILLKTWQGVGHDWIHMACAITSTMMLAKSCAEHHYHEVSGKKKIPTTGEVLISFLYYFLLVPGRLITYAIIFAHYRLYGLILVGALLIVNFVLACILLPKNFPIKTFWTSIAAIVAPACYVSVHTIEIYEISLASSPGKRFRRFYTWNSVAFILLTAVVAVSLNVLSANGIISFWEVPLGIATFGHPMTIPVMGWGSITWIVLSLCATIFVLCDNLRA